MLHSSIIYFLEIAIWLHNNDWYLPRFVSAFQSCFQTVTKEKNSFERSWSWMILCSKWASMHLFNPKPEHACGLCLHQRRAGCSNNNKNMKKIKIKRTGEKKKNIIKYGRDRHHQHQTSHNQQLTTPTWQKRETLPTHLSHRSTSSTSFRVHSRKEYLVKLTRRTPHQAETTFKQPG